MAASPKAAAALCPRILVDHSVGSARPLLPGLPTFHAGIQDNAWDGAIIAPLGPEIRIVGQISNIGPVGEYWDSGHFGPSAQADP